MNEAASRVVGWGQKALKVYIAIKTRVTGYTNLHNKRGWFDLFDGKELNSGFRGSN